jgi:hypothetical protein
VEATKLLKFRNIILTFINNKNKKLSISVIILSLLITLMFSFPFYHYQKDKWEWAKREKKSPPPGPPEILSLTSPPQFSLCLYSPAIFLNSVRLRLQKIKGSAQSVISLYNGLPNE